MGVLCMCNIENEVHSLRRQVIEKAANIYRTRGMPSHGIATNINSKHRRIYTYIDTGVVYLPLLQYIELDKEMEWTV